MRAILIAALFIASPVAACDLDGMFGYNHYSRGATDQAEADARRDAAIADARANFMVRYGISDDAAAGAATAVNQTAPTVDAPR